jgi:hypothetical protein
MPLLAPGIFGCDVHDMAHWVILRLACPPALKPYETAISQLGCIIVSLRGQGYLKLLLRRCNAVIRIQSRHGPFEPCSCTVVLLADSILLQTGHERL